MNPRAQLILDALSRVEAERRQRGLDPTLGEAVLAIKDYQHRRFMRTYADLLADGRFGAAARFFLDELYGPRDYSLRDRQFARTVPGLVRLFPSEVVDTVIDLVNLHALSEGFDTAMGAACRSQPIGAEAYAQAWRAVGRHDDRLHQIDLMLRVGRALDRYTRSALMRKALRLMRGPAEMAGLAALQRFLEVGFDTFARLNGAEAFLSTIARRETDLAEALFMTPTPINGGAAALLGELP